MPAVWRPDTDTEEDGSLSFAFEASRTFEPRSNASEAAAALPDGQRALTPIIAGTISGTCVVVAWFIALVHLLYKRYKRRKRYKQLGAYAANLKSRKEQEERRKKEYIVPPDPAVLEGSHYPGERVVLEEQTKWQKLRGKGRRQRQRKRASSSGNIEFSSGSTLMNGYGSGSGSSTNGKGKERETPMQSPPSPRRVQTTPQGQSHNRRHSFSGSWRSHSYRSGIPKVTEEEEEETLELRPHPFYQLSTIIAASDSQSNLPRIQPPLSPPPPPPPKEDVEVIAPTPRRSSLTVQDLAVNDDDDVSLVRQYAAPKLHKYPPSGK